MKHEVNLQAAAAAATSEASAAQILGLLYDESPATA